MSHLENKVKAQVQYLNEQLCAEKASEVNGIGLGSTGTSAGSAGLAPSAQPAF